MQTGTPNLSEINLAKVLENVNDKYLFEFIPDGILKADEKIGIKRKLIAMKRLCFLKRLTGMNRGARISTNQVPNNDAFAKNL